MANFRLGDIVECIENHRPFADIGTIGKIVRLCGSDQVIFEWISGKFRDCESTSGVNTIYISVSKLKLAKPNIDTLIKRANLGSKAIQNLLEHYPDSIIVLDNDVEYELIESYDKHLDIFRKKEVT